ncbi:MAG: hypothetical protein H0W02_22905 [Ktedonobacteraceae bacterium]|nr:hypothetical protein [Ktedonobacteraceae bacterium]
MNKTVTRRLYLSGLVIGLVGGILIAFGVMGSTVASPIHQIIIHNPTLFYPGVVIAVIASVLLTIAWIGALVKTAQLRQWRWFLGLLVLTDIMLLVYIFVGPERSQTTA